MGEIYKLLNRFTTMGYWGSALNALKNSDVAIVLADARVIESINKEIILKAEKLNKKTIIVFNKSDLIPESQRKLIKKKYKDALLVSGKTKKGINALKQAIRRISARKNKTLRVGLFGYPNTGKSTILNLLNPAAKEKVSKISGETKRASYKSLGKIVFIDTPGVVPKEDKEKILALYSSKNLWKIKNKVESSIEILNYLITNYPNSIYKTYGVESKDPYSALVKIGKKKGYLLKKGEIDEERSASKIIRDWNEGKIFLF